MRKKCIFLSTLLSITIILSGCSSRKPADPNAYKNGTQKKEVQLHKNVSRNPEWIKNSVIYEVNWRQYTKEGTIQAFEKHLPRLKDMGVDVLWFMPIYPISKKNRIDSLGSYYSVADYKAVNPEFGTTEEFKALVNKCHEMGFKVILDWVANHTGWDNTWINNPNWYTHNKDGKIISPAGTNWQDAADLNYDNADMRKAMLEAMKYWVKDIDIDGYRCDYAGGVPQDFWETAREELDKIKPVYMLAEDDQNITYLDKAFNANYGWALYNTMNDVGKGTKDASDIKSTLQTNDYYPEGTYPLNFITNHDENSWNGTEYERLGKAVKTMTALTFTVPGIPLIYSGQEAGLNKRLQFFVKDEISWKDLSMQDFYKNLITLKRQNKALWNGEYGGTINYLETTNDKNIFAFYRQKDNNKVIVIMNLSDSNIKEKIKFNELEGKYKIFSTTNTIRIEKEQSIELGPWEYKILIQ